ncbi:MAG: major capsid protein [Candidatus Riflebacteria bacterium]|nr:major capsid protein [Candidatus Riflebacteria bacterium]
MGMSPSQIRVIDPVLTTVAFGYKNRDFIGNALFPAVPVGASGGQVITFGKEAFKLYNTRRAPGTVVKRVTFGYLGTSFALLGNALAGVVPIEYLRDAKQLPGIDLGTRALNLAMRCNLLTLEVEQAAIALNAALYDSSHKVTLSGTSKWSDPSPASDPVKTIGDYCEAIRASTGVNPNVFALSALAFNALKNNPYITDRFKHTSAGSITAEMLAALLDIKKIVIGKAIYDDNGTFADIWGNNAVLAYVPESPSGAEEPSYGYTYTMQDHPVVEEAYYDQDCRSWIYPVIYERAPVSSGITCGFLIQNPN